MFKKTNLASLRLMAFVQVMKNVQSFLGKEQDLATKGLAEIRNEFDKAFTTLEEALSQVKKNEQTKNILELDKQRDILLTSFYCSL